MTLHEIKSELINKYNWSVHNYGDRKLQTHSKNQKQLIIDVAEIVKNNYANPKISERVLDRPANHHLIDIFKELKFGRPAASQQYLEECIKELTAEMPSH